MDVGGIFTLQSLNGIVVYMKEYNHKKRIKETMNRINPVLSKQENNIKSLLDTLFNDVLSEDEYRVIEAKIKLGQICLDIEKIIKDCYVTMLFYSKIENKIYHGAAPNFPVDFFDFFLDINDENSFTGECGSCGYAVHHQQAVVTDIETSPLWEPFKNHFLTSGFLTGWSLPFYKGRDVIGTFAIYHKFKKNVTYEEINLVEKKIQEHQNTIYQLSEQFIVKNA